MTLNRIPESAFVPEQASGAARVKLKRRRSGIYSLRVTVNVEFLPKQAGKHFEVWLGDKETGYNLSLGVLDVDRRGNGRLTVKRTTANLAAFDSIVITAEPRRDDDPTKNGAELLRGASH